MAPPKRDLYIDLHVPTLAELARLLACSEKTIQNRITAGKLAPTGSTLADHIQAMFASMAPAKGNPALEVERTRLVKEQADHAAIKNAKLTSELVPVDEMERAVRAVLVDVRQALLAIPQTLGPDIAPVTDPVEATALVQFRIHEAMQAIADANFESIITDAVCGAQSSDEDDSATTEA